MRIIQYSFNENKLRHRIRLFFAAMQMGSVNNNSKESEKRLACRTSYALLILVYFYGTFKHLFEHIKAIDMIEKSI